MGTAMLEMPNGVCAPFEIGTLGAHFESSTMGKTKLVSSDLRLIKELILVLDKQLLVVLDSRSVAEFTKARSKVLGKYLRALRALQDTMSNLVSEGDIESKPEDEHLLAELNADLEKQRGLRFGDALINQGIFTLWTLGKIRSLGRRIMDGGEPKNKKADQELHSEYQACSVWSQFHLDLMFAAIKFKKNVSDDIQEAICDGLRAAVNAYAIMKEALSLRINHVEPSPVAGLPWDEEDERLLASSMRDINATAKARGC